MGYGDWSGTAPPFSEDHVRQDLTCVTYWVTNIPVDAAMGPRDGQGHAMPDATDDELKGIEETFRQRLQPASVDCRKRTLEGLIELHGQKKQHRVVEVLQKLKREMAAD